MEEEFEPDMVFEDIYGDIVKLDMQVPGDGTKWFISSLYKGSWFSEGSIYESCDFLLRRKDLE